MNKSCDTVPVFLEPYILPGENVINKNINRRITVEVMVRNRVFGASVSEEAELRLER